MANTGKLSNEQKVFVVQALASFDSAHEVAKMVKEAFGITIAPQSIEFYDPTKKAGENVADRWRKLFWATREAFLKEEAAIGISHRVVRMRKLQRQVDLNEQRGNSAMVAQLLEQAAKEMGNAYSNKHRLEHTGKDGGPINTVDLTKLTGEELNQLERIFSPLARSGDDAAAHPGGEKPPAG
jgi:hypothetical protein